MPVQLNGENGDEVCTTHPGGKLETTGRKPYPPVFGRLLRCCHEAGFGLAFVLGLLLLAQTGCARSAGQPSPTIAIEAPARWSAAGSSGKTGAASLGQWWLRFHDPLLESLVTRSMQANTSVNEARAALRQARALRDVSAAALWPSLDFSASAQRSKSGDDSAVDRFAVDLDASWEADIFGANRSALDSSEATARASAADLGDVQISIAAEVALAYIALRDAQAQLAIADDNLASQRETLQITLWRLQAGLVTSLEAEQARTAVEQTSALLPTLQTGIDQNCHALAVLTGQPPAALLTLLAAPGPMPRAADDLALSFPAETLRQRPDVRAAEHRVSAAAGRLRQADAARLPSLRLGGSLGLNALTLGSLTDSASVVSALLADAVMPVIDGGGRRAQVRAEQAALDQALAAYQAAVLTALQDVEDALVALRGDRERLLRLQSAAEAAGNAALLARQQYSSGLVDFQTVLETQRSQLSTQADVAGARADVSSGHVRLYKALGGGWPAGSSDEPPNPSENTPRSPAL